jgi:uncharacterized paraquat-inducible protein A
VDIVTGLSATSNAISIIKAIKDTDKALDSVALKAQLVDALDQLMNAKLSQIELAEKVTELEKEVQRLRASNDQIDCNGYKYNDNEGQPIGWPACPKCLENERRISFLLQDGAINSSKCPRCDSKFAPVDHYSESGRTAIALRSEQRARKSAEATAAIRQYNGGSWMSR